MNQTKHITHWVLIYCFQKKQARNIVVRNYTDKFFRPLIISSTVNAINALKETLAYCILSSKSLKHVEIVTYATRSIDDDFYITSHTFI